MLVVAIAFALVFLFRDLQVLSIARVPVGVRFIGYIFLITAGVAIFGWLNGGRPGWIERRFAVGAIIVQLLELIAVWFLRLYDLGRYGWLGCLLPAPAFLLSLYFLGWQLQALLPGSGAFSAVAIVTTVWLCLVIILASVLHAFDDCWEDRPKSKGYSADVVKKPPLPASDLVSWRWRRLGAKLNHRRPIRSPKLIPSDF